jgi:hypothetical protein
MPGREKSHHSLLTRITAVLAVLLVLVLTVLAASPELHERLHGHGAHAPSHAAAPAGQTAPDDDDGGCVVTLFAQGVVMALTLFALAFTGQKLRLADFAVFDRILPTAPSYLFLPTQAPPLGSA